MLKHILKMLPNNSSAREREREKKRLTFVRFLNVARRECCGYANAVKCTSREISAGKKREMKINLVVDYR